jgi:cation diffusion facilitator CzcD-associated flavoprotein CzcO
MALSIAIREPPRTTLSTASASSIACVSVPPISASPSSIAKPASSSRVQFLRRRQHKGPSQVDAITGAFDRIDVRGAGGRRLRDKWAEGPRTYLGLQIVGFPNLFTLVGPHNAATFCNIPRCIEQNVDWVTALIAHMRAERATRASRRLARRSATGPSTCTTPGSACCSPGWIPG